MTNFFDNYQVLCHTTVIFTFIINIIIIMKNNVKTMETGTVENTIN